MAATLDCLISEGNNKFYKTTVRNEMGPISFQTTLNLQSKTSVGHG